MKQTTRMLHLLAGLSCCMTATVVFAVCVTPKQLNTAAHDLSVNTYYATAPVPDDRNEDFVRSFFIGRTATTPTFTGLAPLAGRDLAGNVAAQLAALNSDSDPNTGNWQKIAATPNVTGAINPLNNNLNQVQKWASFGELVIAISDPAAGANSRAAIVVPVGPAPPAGAPPGPNWMGLTIPCIAYAGTSANFNAYAPMSALFDDPAAISFFRYKN